MQEIQEKLTKELAEKLIAIQGECRGIHLRNDAEYILAKKGQKGLGKVEKELAGLGYPMKYGEIKNMEFYPAGYRGLSLLGAKTVFDWKDEDMRKMCGYAARISFIVRLYMKFFYSVPKILEKASKMWQEYWTHGRLDVVRYDEKNKIAVIEINDFDMHPAYCRCMEGYIGGLTKMVTKSKKVKCVETSCTFEDGDGHEFEIRY